jgi:hypothetical protein
MKIDVISWKIMGKPSIIKENPIKMLLKLMLFHGKSWKNHL